MPTVQKEPMSRKQDRFLLCLTKLIVKAHELGLHVTLGRGFLSPEQNALDKGKPHSNHLIKLAHDFCFYDFHWNYITDSMALKPLGDYWKTLDKDARWGGDFPGDGNHFSFEHEGYK